MPRNQLSPAEKRRTIAFTLTGKDIKQLDKFIEEEQKENKYAVISRQTILERLVKEFLGY